MYLIRDIIYVVSRVGGAKWIGAVKENARGYSVFGFTEHVDRPTVLSREIFKSIVVKFKSKACSAKDSCITKSKDFYR